MEWKNTYDNSDFLQKLKDMKEASENAIQDLKRQREELLRKDNENGDVGK